MLAPRSVLRLLDELRTLVDDGQVQLGGTQALCGVASVRARFRARVRTRVGWRLVRCR